MSDSTISQLHSREAEEAVVGAVLIDPDLFRTLSIQHQYFYIQRLAVVYAVYERLYEQKTPIDFLTVCEELARAGQLDDVGGPAYITSLLNCVPTTLNTEAYADIVRDYAIRRKMLMAANELAGLAYNTELDTTGMLTRADHALRDVGQGARQTVSTAHDVAARVYDQIYERQVQALSGAEISLDCVPTGLPAMDQMLDGGLQNDRLYVFSGRPSSGKTAWMTSISRHQVGTLGKKVLFFSLEMSNEQLMMRFLAQQSEVNSSKLRTGVLRQDEMERVHQAVVVISGSSLYLDDTPSLTPAVMRAKCHQLNAQLKSDGGLDLVVLDYLQLMNAGTGMKFGSREQEVAYISRSLKQLGRELSIPMLVAAQMNRNSETRADREPMLSDLRESGTIENDADVVMFIWRPDPKNNVSRVKFAKNRDGMVGYVDLFFNAALTRFEELPQKG